MSKKYQPRTVYESVKIEKDIPITKTSLLRHSSVSLLLEKMKVGDSVFFYRSTNASYLANALRRSGCKSAMRQVINDGERVGYRVWKI